MASLSSILETKGQDLTLVESNLESGEIYVFHPGVEQNTREPFSWTSPGDGTVTVEVWGASGSGAGMCCCGAGVPGNSGAYAIKEFAVNNSSTITGTLGHSCGSMGYCYRGRSTATCICWVGSAENGCICAGGGDGGHAYRTGSSAGAYCCMVANGIPGTPFASAGCGIICNAVNAVAEAIGGDTNCSGGISCKSFYHCNVCCWCSQYDHIETSAGLYSDQGAMITYSLEGDNPTSVGPTMTGFYGLLTGLNATSRTPEFSHTFNGCWTSRGCGCYQMSGCQTLLPHGIPGPTGSPCDNVRSYGIRGGHGLVRIRFLGT